MMRGAVATVFQTMAQRGVHLLGHQHTPGPHAALHELSRDHGPVVVGSVGFVGRANGLVYLYLSETLARQLTCEILGLSAADLAREGFDLVKDAIGELTNIVAGTFKNQLCTQGLSCHLTIPTVEHGPPFAAEAMTNSSRWALEFETQGARFVADVLCQPAP
jgi:chemotaxis protein CheX